MCHIIWWLRSQYCQCQFSIISADDLVPICHQNVGNCRDDVAQLAYIKIVHNYGGNICNIDDHDGRGLY